jgi:hypothetical protein
MTQPGYAELDDDDGSDESPLIALDEESDESEGLSAPSSGRALAEGPVQAIEGDFDPGAQAVTKADYELRMAGPKLALGKKALAAMGSIGDRDVAKKKIAKLREAITYAEQTREKVSASVSEVNGLKPGAKNAKKVIGHLKERSKKLGKRGDAVLKLIGKSKQDIDAYIAAEADSNISKHFASLHPDAQRGIDIASKVGSVGGIVGSMVPVPGLGAGIKGATKAGSVAVREGLEYRDRQDEDLRGQAVPLITSGNEKSKVGKVMTYGAQAVGVGISAVGHFAPGHELLVEGAKKVVQQASSAASDVESAGSGADSVGQLVGGKKGRAIAEVGQKVAKTAHKLTPEGIDEALNAKRRGELAGSEVQDVQEDLASIWDEAQVLHGK